MATNGLITPVVDGPGVHNRFGSADDVLDRPERLVDVSDRLGIVHSIGAQNPEPVVARFGFDLEEDEDPISELNNEKQMDEQPAEPGKKPAQLDHLQIGDCFISTDRGHAPFVPILERFRGTPEASSKNVPSGLFSRLHREWGNSRKRFPALVRKIGDITEGSQYPFHYLILAAGARHSYFGNDHWEAFAPGLKNLSDALELRRRILNAFEIAETAADAEVQQAAMTFVVIGAGPTGVEMAGSISELARRTIVHDFRNIQTKQARIVLLDAAPKVLPMFDDFLCASALKQLEKLDIEVKVGTKVVAVTPEGVQLENGLIRARTVIWAAGNAASPLAKQLGETDRQGRIIVNEDLSVPGHPEIFAICSKRNLPQVAQTFCRSAAHFDPSGIGEEIWGSPLNLKSESKSSARQSTR